MARFLVQQDPGVQIIGVGFFGPGKVFDAPDGYTPSLALLPLDAEAHALLTKAKKANLERIVKLREKAGLPELTKGEREELLAVPAIPKAPEKPKPLTPEQAALAELAAQGKPVGVPSAPPAPAAAAASKRASDA